MKFKEGDKVRIVDRLCGHEFEIGEITVITKVNEYDYKVENETDFWYVRDDEIEKLEEE